jgi:heme/copper-type cytochrome/quinol oxidase subunit 2
LIDRPAAGLEVRLSTLTLVILGFVAFLVLLTVVLVFVIGIREAADEDQSAPEDLTELERSLVDREDEPEERSPS